jgi:hypothetical protein
MSQNEMPLRFPMTRIIDEVGNDIVKIYGNGNRPYASLDITFSPHI